MDRGKKHPFVEEIGNPISLPASKSIVNRLLIIEAITGKKILDQKDISCGDTRVLAEALSSQTTRKYIEQSGTAMRFLTAFLSIRKGEEFVLLKQVPNARADTPQVGAGLGGVALAKSQAQIGRAHV